jgi:dihydroorotase
MIELPAEVTPHHLFFNDKHLEDYNTNLKVAPPIRDSFSREALIKGIRNGTIDCIASDHAPHIVHEKETTFDLASCGLIGLESCLGVIKKILADEEGISLINLIKLLTISPRKIMGFDNNLLEIGKEAELVIFDDKKRWIFQEKNIESKSKNSPFINQELSGRVKFTISNGQIATCF